jgi:pimeloyl-ACP methyl ester carboxylesterase
VYAVDRRGRGESEDGPTYAIEREFEDIAAVVDSFSSPVNLLGHSFGGICSLEAARLTRNISRLILYEPPVLPNSTDAIPPRFADELDDLIREGRRDEAIARFFEVVLKRPAEFVDGLRSDPSWSRRVAAAHTVPREMRIEQLYRFEPERFRGIVVPTLVIEGDQSAPWLRASTLAVHQALPNSRLVVLPGQGHAAMNWAPELFAETVLQFLNTD